MSRTMSPQALARYVIVFNCSDGVDFKMTGKMFSGLAQVCGVRACVKSASWTLLIRAPKTQACSSM
jgi:hypothetical protein